MGLAISPDSPGLAVSNALLIFCNSRYIDGNESLIRGFLMHPYSLDQGRGREEKEERH